jgi:hypothetical protein
MGCDNLRAHESLVGARGGSFQCIVCQKYLQEIYDMSLRGKSSPLEVLVWAVDVLVAGLSNPRRSPALLEMTLMCGSHGGI